jgi:hypothetical protein
MCLNALRAFLAPLAEPSKVECLFGPCWGLSWPRRPL